jgi:hypothetical protein
MCLITMIGRAGVGIIKILVLLLTGRVAATAAIATALEAGKAAATTRHATAAAANDANHDAKNDEASDDDDGDYRPSGECSVSGWRES